MRTYKMLTYKMRTYKKLTYKKRTDDTVTTRSHAYLILACACIHARARAAHAQRQRQLLHTLHIHARTHRARGVCGRGGGVEEELAARELNLQACLVGGRRRGVSAAAPPSTQCANVGTGKSSRQVERSELF